MRYLKKSIILLLNIKKIKQLHVLNNVIRDSVVGFTAIILTAIHFNPFYNKRVNDMGCEDLVLRQYRRTSQMRRLSEWSLITNTTNFSSSPNFD